MDLPRIIVEKPGALVQDVVLAEPGMREWWVPLLAPYRARGFHTLLVVAQDSLDLRLQETQLLVDVGGSGPAFAQI